MHILLLAAAVLLASCSSTSVLAPHKIDVQQGNYVTQEMVSKLRPGMTRSQVRFLLGTPLVADAFHTNRWDYFYRLDKGGQVAEQRKLAVIFEEDKLARVEGDVVAAPARPATDKGVELPAKKQPDEAEKEQPKQEKGFFRRMIDKLGF